MYLVNHNEYNLPVENRATLRACIRSVQHILTWVEWSTGGSLGAQRCLVEKCSGHWPSRAVTRCLYLPLSPCLYTHPDCGCTPPPCRSKDVGSASIPWSWKTRTSPAFSRGYAAHSRQSDTGWGVSVAFVSCIFLEDDPRCDTRENHTPIGNRPGERNAPPTRK